MEILVERKYKKDAYTVDKCYVNGCYFSDGLEDRDRGLSDSMAPEEIKGKKVYGETAIPTGTYEIMMTHSAKFCKRPWGRRYNGEVPEIRNVKGFAGVRIHPFNKASESLGCLSVGKNTAKGMVTSSTEYYYKLLDNYIIPALNRKEKVTITIR